MKLDFEHERRQQGGEGDCKRLHKDAAAKIMLVANNRLQSPNKACASS